MDSAWVQFRLLFTEIMDIVAPIKVVRIKAKSEPWMTTEILDLIRQRDSWLYKYRKYKREEDHKIYRALRNKIHRVIRNAKSEFMLNKVEEHRKNPKNYGNVSGL